MKFLLYNPFETDVSLKEAKRIYRRDPQPEKPLIASPEVEKLQNANDVLWKDKKETEKFITENAEQARWEILRQFTGQFDFSRYTDIKSDGTIEHSFFQKDAGFEDYLESFKGPAEITGVAIGARVAPRVAGMAGRMPALAGSLPGVKKLANPAGHLTAGRLAILAKRLPGVAKIVSLATRLGGTAVGHVLGGPLALGVDAALLTYALLDDDPNATDNTALQNFTLAINAIEARAMQKLDDSENDTDAQRLDIARHTARNLSKIVGYTVEIQEGSGSSLLGQRTPDTDQFGLETNEEGFVQKKEADMANIDQALETTGYDAEAQKQIKALMLKVDTLELDWRGWTLTPGRESEDDVSYQKTAIKSKIMEIYANPDIAAYIQQTGADINTRFFGKIIQDWSEKMLKREGLTHLDFGTSDTEVNTLVGLLDRRKEQIKSSIEKEIIPFQTKANEIKEKILDFNITIASDLNIIEPVEPQEEILKGTLTYKKLNDAINSGEIEIIEKSDGTKEAVFVLRDTNMTASEMLTGILTRMQPEVEKLGSQEVTDKYTELATDITGADFNDTGDKNPKTLAERIARLKQTIQDKQKELEVAREIAKEHIEKFKTINQNLATAGLTKANWPAEIPENIDPATATFDQSAEINSSGLLDSAKEALEAAKTNLRQRVEKLEKSKKPGVQIEAVKLKKDIEGLNIAGIANMDDAVGISSELPSMAEKLKGLEAVENGNIVGATTCGEPPSTAEISRLTAVLDALKQDHKDLAGQIDKIKSLLQAQGADIKELQNELATLRASIRPGAGGGGGTGGGESPGGAGQGDVEVQEENKLNILLKEYADASTEEGKEAVRKQLRPLAGLPPTDLQQDKSYPINFTSQYAFEKLTGGHLFGPNYPTIYVSIPGAKTPGKKAIYDADIGQYFNEDESRSHADANRVEINKNCQVKILEKRGEAQTPSTTAPTEETQTRSFAIEGMESIISRSKGRNMEGAVDRAASAIFDDILGRGIGGTLQKLGEGNIFGAVGEAGEGALAAVRKIINVPSNLLFNKDLLKDPVIEARIEKKLIAEVKMKLKNIPELQSLQKEWSTVYATKISALTDQKYNSLKSVLTVWTQEAKLSPDTLQNVTVENALQQIVHSALEKQAQ